MSPAFRRLRAWVVEKGGYSPRPQIYDLSNLPNAPMSPPPGAAVAQPPASAQPATWMRHPAESYQWRYKRRHPPAAGDLVRDCRGIVSRVISVDEDGDSLTLEGGRRCSWMHCCERPADWLHRGPGD
jgi:hypothetical protein